MKIVTYNIQFGRGRDGEYDLSRIARSVNGADVIALQEVERYWQRSGMVDQVAELVRLLPDYYWVFGPGVDVDAAVDGDLGRRRQFGNMLFTRAPILSSRNHLLPKTDLADKLSLQRAALEGVIAPSDGPPIRFYSLHLAHVTSAERQEQVRTLRYILSSAPTEGGAWSGGINSPDWAGAGERPPMPPAAILMGDFNMEPGVPEYEIMVSPFKGSVGMTDAWVAAGNGSTDGPTSLERFGPRRIDYTFLTAELATGVRSARVDDEADGSDHQPLWIEIDIAMTAA